MSERDQPLFQAVHHNFDLPLFDKNFECRYFSTMNISLIRSEKNTNADNDEEIHGVGYALHTVLVMFNHRWDETVYHKDIPMEDFRKYMFLFVFCDRFNSFTTQSKGEEENHLRLTIRQTTNKDESVLYPLNLKPFIYPTYANPKSLTH